MMRIWTGPRIYTIQRPRLVVAGVREFLEDEGQEWASTTTNSAQNVVEIAGKLCYMSFSQGRSNNKAYIEHILESGHGSVLEHANWSFIITGISRSLSHELVRHRVGMSYSQLSQRFVDEGEVGIVIPPAMMNDQAAIKSLIMDAEYAVGRYKFLVESMKTWPEFTNLDPVAKRKKIREAARAVLPNCAETKVFLTGNARSLRGLLLLRGSVYADAEFLRLSLSLYHTLKADAPGLFGDIVEVGGKLEGTRV